MPFKLDHTLLSQVLVPERHDTPDAGCYFTVESHGPFKVMHTGTITRDAKAWVVRSYDPNSPEIPDPEPAPILGGLGGGARKPSRWKPTTGQLKPVVRYDQLKLDLVLYDPDGNEFTRDEVTAEDLDAFRTLRGLPRPWRYTLVGTSPTYPKPNEAQHGSVSDPAGLLELTLVEYLYHTSAPPLIDGELLPAEVVRYPFDLFRVGRFAAEVSAVADGGEVWAGSLRLLDGEGTEVANSGTGALECEIKLAALGASRDAAGAVLPWTLEVLPQLGTATAATHTVSAQVFGQVKLKTDEVNRRLQTLLGENGEYLTFEGRDASDQIQLVLTIHDIVAAETLDMHGVLDAYLAHKQGDAPVVDAEVPMLLARHEAELDDFPIRLSVGTLRTTSVTASVKDGTMAQHGEPVLRLDIAFDGAVGVTAFVGPLVFEIATIRARGGNLGIELGIDVVGDGIPRIKAAVAPDAVDIEWDGVILAAFVAAVVSAAATNPLYAILGVVAVEKVQKYLEGLARNMFLEELQERLSDPDLAPGMMMLILGTHVKVKAPRFEPPGTTAQVIFEYVAPVEPEPKPRINYAAAVGQTVVNRSDGHVTFVGDDPGDTWAGDNLAKIDHIVIVMMENRSYDHVLGYRAAPSAAGTRPADGADGWTPELRAAVNDNIREDLAESLGVGGTVSTGDPQRPTQPVQPMRFASFDRNSQGRMTRLPKGVGHSVASVRQQLAGTIDLPDGRRINDPRGFVANFRERYLHNQHRDIETKVDDIDVLRYYESDPDVVDPFIGEPVDDLPVYRFLAEHYGYSDAFFCSHPGPTLPNRMYWLTGDVQHDRQGFPIFDNNSGDNFLLSRAPTIFDVLEREGVSWRVYESKPSVAMLRFFARYAGDDFGIRPIEEFASDCAAPDAAASFPEVVIVEPQMHAHPEDDDHPDADMWRGQEFIRRVYEPLAANTELWSRTMLVITYDEHGGLYDHVIPPAAEVLVALGVDGKVDDLIVNEGMTLGEGRPERDPNGDSEPPPGEPGSGGDPPLVDGGDPPLGTRHVGRGRAREWVNEPGTGGDPPIVDGGEARLPKPEKERLAVVPYGVRVPTFVVSPWVPAGKGPSVVLDFCSILKTILVRFCGDSRPFLSDRVAAARSLNAFLTEPAARPAPPGLPEIPPLERKERSGDLPSGGIAPGTAIGRPALFRRQMVEGDVEFHDLGGRLARMLGR